MLDPTMVQNVLRTDSHEARELLNWDMVDVGAGLVGDCR